jgi:hypothetical protein
MLPAELLRSARQPSFLPDENIDCVAKYLDSGSTQVIFAR